MSDFWKQVRGVRHGVCCPLLAALIISFAHRDRRTQWTATLDDAFPYWF